MQAWLENNTEEYTLLSDENGFRLRFTFQDATIGLLDVSEIAFPEYKNQYLNLALVMARLSSMAIINARMFQQVQESAHTDDLTGLSNRRFFYLTAQKEWERAERYGRPLSAIMFDIDHFKQINDTYGHVTGDKLLIALANRCRNALRATDILSRYGGDECILILPETGITEARHVAERLRMNIASAPFETDGHTLTITISLGIATLGANCTSLDELIRHCDEALYRAKRAGRNRIEMGQGELSETN
jgi:diguanylate cyclase (GGDEF)-like protein